jgi:hypothetical protein
MRTILEYDRQQGETKVTLSPGAPATPEDLARAELIEEFRSSELDRVRKAAENWRVGLAGLLGLVTTVSVFQGKDLIAGLSDTWRWTAGGFVLASLISATAGALLAMSAAFGRPSLHEADSILTYRRRESMRAAQSLLAAIVLSVASVIFLASAVGVTWYGGSTPSHPSDLRITTDYTEVCGVVKMADGSNLTIISGQAERVIPVTDVRAISVVENCN